MNLMQSSEIILLDEETIRAAQFMPPIPSERERWYSAHSAADFVDTDINRFPKDLWARVMAWDGTKQSLDPTRPDHKTLGLGLRGKTGLGKTRMLYERLWLSHKSMAPLIHTTGYGLQSLIQNQWRDDNAKRRLAKCRVCKTLFINELGRFKFTEEVEGAVFDLIDYRYQMGLRIVFTSNMTGKEIEEGMRDKSGSMMRRLRDMCHVINADKLCFAAH